MSLCALRLPAIVLEYTHWSHLKSFSRMESHVFLDVLSASARVLALVASERLLAVVSLHVVFNCLSSRRCYNCVVSLRPAEAFLGLL